MTPGSVVHLIVGPAQHGVVRHALEVATACGHAVVRVDRPAEVDLDVLVGFATVHTAYTDRLFAARCEDSATAYEELTRPLLERGAALSVTLHDMPAGEDPLEVRRRAAYQRVVANARGIVVQSRRELGLAARLSEDARSLRQIPLPVTVHPLTRPEVPGPDVVVLGFVFPDRGYEHTLDELPVGLDLVALGTPSAGHEDLPEQLARRAAAQGHRMQTTGFIPDAELPARLRTAGIPVAPNRRVAASGSIATWLGHGRRPLVPITDYSLELDGQWPGSLTLYDADVPGDLRRAIARAQADPGLTWLAPGVTPGPTITDVAAAYATHLADCAPETRISIGHGRWVVPGNRWDLLADLTPTTPPVSVVIPYFEAQPQLDLVLAALTLQTHDRLQVVVADDGSRQPPDLGAAAGLDVQLVRQPDLGFRAGAARNLGAAAADGEVLLFLDGDTIPEPDYVRRLTRLPALAPDAVTVGRRRHADLQGWSADRVLGWLGSATGPPTELAEPGWLTDGYSDSADLLHADERSYRYVISAVLGLHRDLFVELGGFTESFSSYGGEDWELAHRAYAAGAVLAHVRDAVAWHDGPDWAGRAAAESPPAHNPHNPHNDKNAETLALARYLPDPVARGGGQWLPYPAIVVTLAADDPAAVLATARSAFAGDTDCGVWLTGRSAHAVAAQLGDPRIQAGPVPAAVSARATTVVELDGPARLTDLSGLARQAHRHGQLRAPAGTITPTRAMRRKARWAQPHLFGVRDVIAPERLGEVDLPHELKQTYRSTRRS